MSTSGNGPKGKMAAATLAALGIVFGDIGTSPLYAFRECFHSEHHDALPSPENLIGAASLILWSLILVVSVKYLFIILRLDNRGEGGILSLSALIRRLSKPKGGKDPRLILLLGLAGAALIYADGMLTPAISVLSAVEGLSFSAPKVAHYTIPIAVALLVGLFAIQKHGTGKVGNLFGPVVLLWFTTLAVLGLSSVVQSPQVLLALSPWEGIGFLIREWNHALPMLGAVFLAVTGGEALYADLGHFGKRPIRIGWFSVAFPALMINYLGQAALLTRDQSAIAHPFFLMAPEFLRLPLTILASAAAVIASQALISGAFSLTTQAIQLGCLPRFSVRYTSQHEKGQVYVPAVNWLLAVACVLLVVTLKTSSALASAYGIAIAVTMFITSVMFVYAAPLALGWSKTKTLLIGSLFLIIEFGFLIANATKILHFGWLPLVVAGVVMSQMLIWLWGRERLLKKMTKESLPVDILLKEISRGAIHRVSGIAVYLTGRNNQVPGALLHNLKHNKVLHETVLLLHVETTDESRVDPGERLDLIELGEGMMDVTLRFGFAETPDVPQMLGTYLPEKIRFKPGKTTFFLGRETYRMSKDANMFDRIRLSLFGAMARNASPATAYFQLPPGRVVELGAQITL
ncbi:MAG: potassium transporter Kup [Verrucomicrobiota bacterium]